MHGDPMQLQFVTPLGQENAAESIADQHPTTCRLVPSVVVRTIVGEDCHGGELVVLDETQRLTDLGAIHREIEELFKCHNEL